MNGYSIFIVEDDPWYGQILEYHLGLNPDYHVRRFLNAKELLGSLHLRPDLITLDFSLPDRNADQVFKEVKAVLPEVPVIVISSQEKVKVAVDLLKQGVADYLVKDEATKDLLWNSILRIRETQCLKKEVSELKEELVKQFSFGKMLIGQSPEMLKLFALMEKATKTNLNVSITGETGTGKEVVAKAIHYGSLRKKMKFVALNMAAIPANLVESELFGYEKGAFTGANTRKTGKFEEANGGTLFLDEIAELDMSLQSKILRALQEREVTRLGGHEVVKFDARLIVASHKRLAEEVNAGRFREDLYYRIMGLPIDLPPLRHRGNDILLLARHFLDNYSKINKNGPFSLSEAAKTKLMKHPYPGNVRELRAIIDLAAVMSDQNQIQAEDITFNTIGNAGTFSMESKSLKEYTTEIIKYYLNKYDQDVQRAAQALNIGKSTIYNMLKSGELNG